MSPHAIETNATQCTICETFNNAREIYKAQLEQESLDKNTFSARRFYNKKNHFRIVKCNQCGLIRSDPRIPDYSLAHLYKNSYFTYKNEIPNLKETYGYYLTSIDKFLTSKENLLEIGCGNGFFLEEASTHGFKNVLGIEPSYDAKKHAAPQIHDSILSGMFSKDKFKENYFDVICIFQTLDHLVNPSQILADCFDILKPSGIVIALNHNVTALSARILGERSPIIDIEHTYLFEPSTLRKIFEKNNFTVIKIQKVQNKYSIDYLFSLLPIGPQWLKSGLHNLLRKSRLASIKLFVPLGNICIIAKKSS
jgi:2-polyprenyl-3-methyl-5-hydroxy-6-metoxy-1,4-benzoquinol methylase